MTENVRVSEKGRAPNAWPSSTIKLYDQGSTRLSTYMLGSINLPIRESQKRRESKKDVSLLLRVRQDVVLTGLSWQDQVQRHVILIIILRILIIHHVWAGSYSTSFAILSLRRPPQCHHCEGRHSCLSAAKLTQPKLKCNITASSWQALLGISVVLFVFLRTFLGPL